jgi:arylformamidase
MTDEDIVYAGMTAGEVERNYNLRRAVPDHEAIFERIAKDSAEVREHTDRKWLDLRYGSGDRQLLNLYLPPEGTGPHPVMVFIHGGYWRAFSRESYDYLAPAFIEAGAAFVNLDYDLCPDISLDGLIEQVREGVAWVTHHAGSYDFDTSRVVVSGHSAGGHLTAMMAVTDWSVQGLERPPMRGGIAISGVFDLRPILYTAFNEDIRLTPDSADALSPIMHAPKTSTPLLCAVGAEETDDFKRQQRDFAAIWRQAGANVDEMVVPGRHHFDVVDALSEAGHPLHQAARRMLGIAG